MNPISEPQTNRAPAAVPPTAPEPAAQLAVGWEVVDPDGNVVQSGPVTYVDVSGLVGTDQGETPASDQSEETTK